MKKDGCIFCMIANGEIPSPAAYEDDEFKVILDMGPATKGHALVLPKEHYQDVTESPETAAKAMAVAAKIGGRMKKCLGASGFNILANTGESAGQTVMHMHVHIIPRYDGGDQIVSWVPGQSDPAENARIAEMILSTPDD